MRSKKSTITQLFSKFGIYIVFLAFFVFLSIMNKAFLTSTNLINVLKQTSTVSVIAIGMTFALISGGLDLSAGSVIALSAVCSAMFGLPEGPPTIVPLLVAVSVGTLCGLINGLIIAVGKVPPFIATLGMSLSARGMALLVTNAKPIFGLSSSYVYLGSAKIGEIPVLVLVMLAVLAVATVILEKTKFGRHVYAVGGNERSAHISGINVNRVRISCYLIMGALTGLCGMLLAGRLQSGTPTMGTNYELDAIAGAVIGGVSSSGGVGKVYGAVIGSLLLTMIANGLDLLNVSAYYQQIVKGAIIVAAVMIDVNTKNRGK